MQNYYKIQMLCKTRNCTKNCTPRSIVG